MKQFGLIGKTLKHSFSKSYFSEKFKNEKIQDCRYDLFELETIDAFPELIAQQAPVGLNVTIPYKEAVMPYLHVLDQSAQRVGAVNVIRRTGSTLTGYNSDYYGFRKSLENWLDTTDLHALVLGTGGASKAIAAVLEDLNIPFKWVSRSDAGDYTYNSLTEQIARDCRLWINTTPLGMSPNINSAPEMPYDAVTGMHFLYDLVYNPEETLFLRLGKSKGAKIKNGLEMLYLQAERSWSIWNS